MFGPKSPNRCCRAGRAELDVSFRSALTCPGRQWLGPLSVDGSDEQILGADEQVYGRGQSD